MNGWMDGRINRRREGEGSDNSTPPYGGAEWSGALLLLEGARSGPAGEQFFRRLEMHRILRFERGAPIE